MKLVKKAIQLSLYPALTLLPLQAFSVVLTSPGNYGNTQLQIDTGDAVLVTCKGLDGKNPQQAALAKTCSAMVGTANDLAGEPALVGLSLGLSEEELGDAMQQIATEELGSTQSMASEISNNQMNSSISRLVELRSGVKGFSFTGLFPQYDSNQSLSGGSAGTDWNKMGGFVSANYGFGDKEATDRTNSFDFDSYSISGGLDYRIDNNMIIGAMLSYHNINSDFKHTSTVSGGDVDADGWGGTMYGTYYTDQAYIDLSLGYGAGSYDMTRGILIQSNTNVSGINEVAYGNTDSNDFSTSIGAGYDLFSNGLTYGPYARLSYLNVDIDGYTESGAQASGLNLNVQGQEWTSLTSTLGAKFSYAKSHSFGIINPQASIGWIHEYDADAQIMTATYADDPNGNILKASTNNPDRDYFEFNLGVTAVLTGGTQLYVSYDTILGLDELSQHLISAGARWEF